MTISALAVIGGSRGLGWELAQSATRENVPTAVLSRTGMAPARCLSFAGDLRSPKALAPMVDWLEAHCSPRVVLVTAALLGPVGPIADVDMDLWREAIDVNVCGVAHALHEFVPRLHPEDRIVVFLGAGVGGPNPQTRVSSYVASKAAIAALIESVARDPDTKVPVIGLAPGSFPTQMTALPLQLPESQAGPELLQQCKEAQVRTMDVSALWQVIQCLSEGGMSRFAGRIVAASRQSPEELRALAIDDEDLLRMRRVDGSMISRGKSW